MLSPGENTHGAIDQGWLLPEPAPRQPVHTRSIVCRSFRRDDGLIDIDARFMDTRPFDYDSEFRGECAAGEALHHMQLRVTLDAARTVVDLVSVMQATPYAGCAGVNPNFKRVIGLSMGRGFRKALRDRVGGIEGCTHVLALLDAVAAAAMQSFASDAHQQRRLGAAGPRVWKISSLLDSCWSYRADGEVVRAMKRLGDSSAPESG
jgi:hypothetical protein